MLLLRHPRLLRLRDHQLPLPSRWCPLRGEREILCIIWNSLRRLATPLLTRRAHSRVPSRRKRLITLLIRPLLLCRWYHSFACLYLLAAFQHLHIVIPLLLSLVPKFRQPPLTDTHQLFFAIPTHPDGTPAAIKAPFYRVTSTLKFHRSAYHAHDTVLLILERYHSMSYGAFQLAFFKR